MPGGAGACRPERAKGPTHEVRRRREPVRPRPHLLLPDRRGPQQRQHNTYDATGRLSVSYGIGEHWEPYAQYEFIHFDPAGLAARSQDEVHVLRMGTSYYFYGHNAKLQGDVSYLANGSPLNDTGTGVLQDNGHDEVLFRVQFQLLL